MGTEFNHPRINSAEGEGFTREIQVYSQNETIPFFDSKRFYIVQEGLVAVQDEKERIIRVAKPNVPFGFENFDGEASFAGKVLTKEARVDAIDIDMSNIDTMFDLYRLIAQTAKLQENRQRLTPQGYAPERIAQTLLDTSIPLSHGEGAALVPLSQDTIRQISHTRREQVSRITTSMERAKLIKKRTGSIVLMDPARLQAKVNKV